MNIKNKLQKIFLALSMGIHFYVSGYEARIYEHNGVRHNFNDIFENFMEKYPEEKKAYNQKYAFCIDIENDLKNMYPDLYNQYFGTRQNRNALNVYRSCQRIYEILPHIHRVQTENHSQEEYQQQEFHQEPEQNVPNPIVSNGNRKVWFVGGLIVVGAAAVGGVYLITQHGPIYIPYIIDTARLIFNPIISFFRTPQITQGVCPVSQQLSDHATNVLYYAFELYKAGNITGLIEGLNNASQLSGMSVEEILYTVGLGAQTPATAL